MNETINIVRLRQPDEFDDPLTDVLRTGACKLLAQAIEIEAEAFLAEMKDLTLPDGRERLVRHGRGPERMIQTGIGPVPVSRVKIRDRGANGEVDRVRFSSSILPKWARRTREVWTPCFPFFTCAAFRRATFRTLWQPCSARRRRTSHPR
jgi:hypothetical protein